MNEFLQLVGRRLGSACAWALILAMAAPAWAEAQSSPSQPESAPASRPAKDSPLALEHLPSMLKAVSDALELDEEERRVVADVADGGRYDEQALFVLLSHVQKIPPLDATQQTALEAVPTRILRKHPADYRGRPVKMSLLVFRVGKLMPGKELPYSPYWDRNQPVWRIDCMEESAANPAEAPLVVLTAQDPMKMLGKPKRLTNGVAEYTARQMDVAAVFYKVFSVIDLNGEKRHYPVLLAWQTSLPRGQGDGLKVRPWVMLAIMIPILALLAAFAIMRMLKAASRVRQAPKWRRPEHQAQQQPSPQDALSVDPLLRAAAEEFKKEKGNADGQDGQG